MRQPLRDFALACESKLRIFDVERGVLGWREGWSPEMLYVRLCQELLELRAQLRMAPEDGSEPPKERLHDLHARLRQLQSEACDVANFAMMIFDLADIELKKEIDPR